jgi:hypothetical protein
VRSVVARSLDRQADLLSKCQFEHVTIGVLDSSPVTNGWRAVLGPVDDESKRSSISETSIHFVFARTTDAKVIDTVCDYLNWQEHHDERPRPIADPKNLDATSFFSLVNDCHFGEARVELSACSRICHWHCNVCKSDIGHISNSDGKNGCSKALRRRQSRSGGGLGRFPTSRVASWKMLLPLQDPPRHSPGLVLRLMQSEDLEVLNAASSDPLIRKYLMPGVKVGPA